MNHTYSMFRIRHVKTSIGACLVVVAIYLLLGRGKPSPLPFSVSLDGVYACEVVDKAGAGPAEATVIIRRRVDLNASGSGWQTVFEDRIRRTGPTRPYYAVIWQHGADLVTRGVQILPLYGESSAGGSEQWDYELIEGRWQGRK